MINSTNKISITVEEMEVLNNFISQDIVKPKFLNLVITSFVDYFSYPELVPIDMDTINKLKERYCNSLLVLFPITNNKFHFVNNLVGMIKDKKVIPSQIIFFERESGKLQEWIKTELPIFKDIPIYDVFSMKSKLWRIVWRRK